MPSELELLAAENALLGATAQRLRAEHAAAVADVDSMRSALATADEQISMLVACAHSRVALSPAVLPPLPSPATLSRPFPTDSSLPSLSSKWGSDGRTRSPPPPHQNPPLQKPPPQLDAWPSPLIPWALPCQHARAAVQTERLSHPRVAHLARSQVEQSSEPISITEPILTMLLSLTILFSLKRHPNRRPLVSTLQSQAPWRG